MYFSAFHMDVHSCIVLLCGLPGAGKTTFAKNLIFYTQSCLISEKSSLKTKKVCEVGDRYGKADDISVMEDTMGNGKPKCMLVKHICFDSLIPSDVYSVDGMCAVEGETWKQYRQNIYQKVESDLKGILKVPGASSEQSDITTVDEAYQRTAWNVSPSDEANNVFAFVLDDNMFYRSMRQQYFQLARKYNTGFAEIYIDCPQDLAQHRNVSRPDSVSNATIVNMSSRMEAPDQSLPWEKHSLAIPAGTACLSKNLQLAVDLILSAVQDPVQSLPEVDPSLAETERMICSLSTIHQADLILRKLIGQRMSQSQGITKMERQQQARMLNEARRIFLDDLKSGKVLVSMTLQSDATKASEDISSPFYSFVDETFSERLKSFLPNS